MFKQYQVAKPANGIAATLYLKGNLDTEMMSPAIKLLNMQFGIIDAVASAEQQPVIKVRFNPLQIRGSRIVRTLHKAGYGHSCSTLLYFKGGREAGFEQRVLQTVTAQNGVIAAERSVHKSHVLLVHFDPRQTVGSQIVKDLRKQGYTTFMLA